MTPIPRSSSRRPRRGVSWVSLSTPLEQSIAPILVAEKWSASHLGVNSRYMRQVRAAFVSPVRTIRRSIVLVTCICPTAATGPVRSTDVSTRSRATEGAPHSGIPSGLTPRMQSRWMPKKISCIWSRPSATQSLASASAKTGRPASSSGLCTCRAALRTESLSTRTDGCGSRAIGPTRSGFLTRGPDALNCSRTIGEVRICAVRRMSHLQARNGTFCSRLHWTTWSCTGSMASVCAACG